MRVTIGSEKGGLGVEWSICFRSLCESLVDLSNYL